MQKILRKIKKNIKMIEMLQLQNIIAKKIVLKDSFTSSEEKVQQIKCVEVRIIKAIVEGNQCSKWLKCSKHSTMKQWWNSYLAMCTQLSLSNSILRRIFEHVH